MLAERGNAVDPTARAPREGGPWLILFVRNFGLRLVCSGAWAEGGRHVACSTVKMRFHNKILANTMDIATMRIYDIALQPLAANRAGEFDHLAPLLGFLGDKSAEFGGWTHERRSAVSANRAFIFGSARPALAARLSLLTISADVPLGAPMPYHWLASYPGTNSSTAGMPGKAPDRSLVVTASARSVPALIYSIVASIGAK
jgi:hypothetical protein